MSSKLAMMHVNRSRTKDRRPRFGLLTIAAIAVVGLLSPLPAAGGETSEDRTAVSAIVSERVEADSSAGSSEERWGIRIVGIRRTAGGYMLDFRYRVTDSKKAAPLFLRKDKPYLIAQKSGARFTVPNPPKVGPMRTSDPPQDGRVYWMFFGNPGKYLAPGDAVTVVIGDVQLKDLIVD